MMQTINIKYHDDKYGLRPRLQSFTNGDWVDLYVAEDVNGLAGDSMLIPLGVSIELPVKYEALVAPRSSSFKRYGVIQTNSIGVIDNSYCGDNDEWMYPVYFTRDIIIPEGTRICQFRVLHNQEDILFIEKDTLGNPDRNGFGSTGV